MGKGINIKMVHLIFRKTLINVQMCLRLLEMFHADGEV